MTPRTSNIQFSLTQLDNVLALLTSVDKDLKSHFDKYLEEKYKEHLTERVSYIDIAEISRFLVDKVKAGQTGFFQNFFNQVELILSNCDSDIDNLMVVGLFEGIQNISGRDIDYYYGFNKWLQPLSKQKWDHLIDSWEGKGWRVKNEGNL